MRNSIKTGLYVSIAFIAGCLTTYIILTKQSMDALMQQQAHTGIVLPDATATPHNTHKDAISLFPVNGSVLVDQPDKGMQTQKTNDLPATTKDYTAAQAQAIIDDMPDIVLEQYVDKFMVKDASSAIPDKRRFAKRAIEELYQANDTRPLHGEVRLSFNATMPIHSAEVSTIAKDAKIYAHLDTGGRVPASPYVFVKWVNNQTGQVLLFEKKDIVANSDQNWVSFKPDAGWQQGSYDIRFYQFTSELEPIAQLTYDIYEVIDTKK